MRSVFAGLTLAATFTLALGAASPANAASSYQLLSNANIRTAPTTGAPIANVLLKNTAITIDCYVNGQTVNGTSIWDHVPGQGWVSDSLVLTGSDNPVVPNCVSYDRNAAADWARTHANDPASTYRFGNDCTWFVSNALWKGGLPETTEWTRNTTNLSLMADRPYVGPSKAAAAADWFKNALVDAGYATISELDTSDKTAGGAQLGDVIVYDWDTLDGQHHADGFVDHAAIVTNLSAGTVQVSQHSGPRLDKDWAMNPASNRNIGSEGGRAYLLHIRY